MKVNSKSEITVSELEELPEGSFSLIDIRNDESYSYGSLPGAVHIPENIFMEKIENNLDEIVKLISAGKDEPGTMIFVCTRGEKSKIPAEIMNDNGYYALSLNGGYNAWLIQKMLSEKESASAEERRNQIEKDLEKRYRKCITTPFTKAINKYELISPGDRIAVCISGGKDSFLMAKLFQNLKRHNKIPFELKFIVMNPGYSEMNRKMIESNAELLGIPIEMHDSDIFDRVDNVDKNPCYLCARMRRGHLYSMAREAGCNKIALGHHYDDVIETILMGMLYSGQFQTMMPKLHSTNFDGMELIRPLYLIRENDIKRWRDENNLHFIRCACHFTDTCSTFDPEAHNNSKRMETKYIISELKKNNPFIESNIFKSVENVSINSVVAYKKDGVKYHFTETYNQKDKDI